jgi:disulfide bond formation protein DsbB
MAFTGTAGNESGRLAQAALLIAALAAATILGAYFFQFVLGYAPCPLCLEQRIPYYVAIPLALAVAAAGAWGAPARLLALALGLIAIVMLIGAGLGVYHAGVEWKWWLGPSDCSGPVTSFGAAGNLLQTIESTPVVRCDEAAWRFLGLSLAGYNALISLALAGVALWGANAAKNRRMGA